MTSPWSLLTTRGKAFVLIGAVVVATGIVLGYPDVTRIGLVLVALPVLALLLMPRRTPKMRVLRNVDPLRLVTVVVPAGSSPCTPSFHPTSWRVEAVMGAGVACWSKWPIWATEVVSLLKP